MIKIIASSVLFSSLLLACNTIAADTIENDLYFPSRTSAMTFIKQAALIGGAARACGQDVSIFINRVNQMVYKSALSSGDKTLVSAHFQQALVAAQTAQVYAPAVSCEQVLTDFNRLPLMQDNYRATSLQQINPTSGQDLKEEPAPAPPYPSPVSGTIGDHPPPNIIYLAPAGLPPPPNTPVDSNAQNILFVAPSVGTFVDTTKPMPNINQLAPNPWNNEDPPVRITNPYSGRPN